MTNQKSLKISVFSNESMTELLDSYDDYGNIYEIEEDSLDGGDWWYDYADDAEDKFGSKWAKIFIISEDGVQGRVIARGYYLTGEIDRNDFVYHDKLFLIGTSTSENISSHFSGHIIISYRYYEVEVAKFYHKGFDEQIITLLKGFINSELTSPLDDIVIDIVYNPSPQSILTMKLADHYDFMIHLPTKEKVNELIALDKAYEYSDIIHKLLHDTKNIADVYPTDHLDYIKPWLAEIENRINFDSEDSFLQIFKNRFCV